MRGFSLSVFSLVCFGVVCAALPANAGLFGWFRRSAVVVNQGKGEASVVTVRRGWIVESKPVEAKAKTEAKAADCDCPKAKAK